MKLLKTLALATSALAIGVALTLSYPAHATDISGAGATFPAPLYTKWAFAYNKSTGSKVNYQAVGSSGGIKQIKDKSVDFGATDAPLSAADLSAAGLLQFPTAIGGLVPVVNVKGINPGQLKLTGSVLADIYLGKITKWNDPAIASLNAGVSLPDQAIQIVHRADGSGTTFVFTDYLSKVNADWKQKIGSGQNINWPKGTGGKGNEGVSSVVSRTDGAIGYVEYAFAKRNGLKHVSLKNKDGLFVQPDDATFKAAAASADWKANNFAPNLNDGAGKNSWPITSATYILIYKTAIKPENTQEVLKFFDWAYKGGAAMATELEYVPLPESVTSQVRQLWASQVKDSSGKNLYNGK